MSNSSNDNIIIEMIKNLRQDLNGLRSDVNSRFDKLEDELNKKTSKEDCQTIRDNCINNMNIRRSELTIKKMATIGSFITGTIGASAIIVVAIIKIFWG